MKIQLSKCDCKYGAPMGIANEPVSGKCRSQRLYLTIDGVYSSDGTYWGIGEPMYVCEDSEGHQFFVRANTRAWAKAVIQEDNPNVTFYR